MLTKVVHSALEDLGKAWKRLTPLEPYFDRMEVNSKFTAIVPPDEVVASTTFDVEINRAPYTMSLCLPYSMLDPVRAQLEAGKTSYDEEVNAVNVSRLEENLLNSKVGVKVDLGESRMSLRSFLTLKEGDRILLNQDQNKPLKVLVQDKLKYLATQGAYKGKNAVKITKLIEPPPRFSDLLDQPAKVIAEDS
ncbi:MAG: flagellar motor switch protein FliM, partial [Deltaproteobacteria bacterium]|nr:flagellar motor switch protein FliM [Deltaproteobacteria bacterium]